MRSIHSYRCRGNRHLLGKQKREAPGRITSASPYCRINVYRTSLDHLLLGMDADIDRMSTAPIIKPFLKMSKVDFWIVSISKMNRNKPRGTI